MKTLSKSLSRITAVSALAVASFGAHASDPAYFTKYNSLQMTRDARGVLLVEMHTNGGPLKFSAQDHDPRWPPKFPHVWPPQTPPPELIGHRG